MKLKKFINIFFKTLIVICLVNSLFFHNKIFADDSDEDNNDLSENDIKEVLNYSDDSNESEHNNTNNEISSSDNSNNSRPVSNNDSLLNNVKTSNTINENNFTKSANDFADETSAIQKPSLNSRRYAVFDRASGTCIYGKDENKQTAMASTTKIMTAIVVLENCKNLDDVVTIDSKAAGTGGSRLGLKKDDKISINDLLFGLLMRSGNDAAVALANYTDGSIENFADLMNKKANELGLSNTHFVTPHGLDNPEHYTSAFELAKITDYALKNDVFATIVNTRYATIKINDKPKDLKNTNELLLGNVDGVYGVKTGFTGNAGRCLVTAIKRNNMDLIIVVLGADTRKDRAKDTLKLIDYCFKEFQMKSLNNVIQNEYELWKNANENRIVINKGSSKLKTQLGNVKINEIATNKQITTEVNNINYLNAPINQGAKIGEIILKNGNEIIEKVDIIVENTIYKNNIQDYFRIFAKSVCY